MPTLVARMLQMNSWNVGADAAVEHDAVYADIAVLGAPGGARPG